MYVPAHNVTDGPVVIDFEGRVLGGGEWGAVDRTDDAAKVAVDRGALVLAPNLNTKAKDLADAALAAHDEAGVYEARRAALADQDVGHLRDVALAGQLDGPDGDYAALEKAVLVRRLARRPDVDLQPGAAEVAEEPVAKKAAAPARGGST